MPRPAMRLPPSTRGAPPVVGKADQAAGTREAQPVSATAPTLQLNELTARYGDLTAVRGVSLVVRAGEVVALFGANGAGKSTTLKAAVGAHPRASGEVLWMGKRTNLPLHRMARQGLAFVPEERTIVPGLTARDNLRLSTGGVAGPLAHFPELEHVLDRRAGLLSGGEQQMLILGRALSRKPRALLVDELSLGLAPIVVDRLLAALRRAADEDHVAVLLVEQQARRALSVADRWYVMTNGAISGQGDSADGLSTLQAAYLAGAVAKPVPAADPADTDDRGPG
jgi:branched-chain amino acid transport system ATP-binding protein